MIANREIRLDNATIYENAEGAGIYLHEVLVKELRAHQIDTLKFLWREVIVDSFAQEAQAAIESLEDQFEHEQTSLRGGGALVAHTMGLGKTVTLIAFLFTLAEAQGSEPVRTANITLPSKFRKGDQMARILILMPSGLVTNWSIELETWATKFPDKSSCGRKLLSTVYGIRNTPNLDQRIEVLEEWHETGGILLLGHELFRALVEPKRPTYRSETQQSKIDSYLLNPGPELVAADEAHAFKNIQSKITKAVNKIHTRNRIALTASPLSNSLLEFYSLMRWVSPETNLGETVADFRDAFYNPIMNGLMTEETDYEDIARSDDMDYGSDDNSDGDTSERENDKIAGCNRAFQELIKAVQSKMHRRNVDTIKQFLKPKTEFIIRVTLTDRQHTLYNEYLEERADSSSIWKHYCLRALCNHPEVFKKVLKRGVGKKRVENGWALEGKVKRGDNSNSVRPFEASEVVTPREQTEGYAEGGKNTALLICHSCYEGRHKRTRVMLILC